MSFQLQYKEESKIFLVIEMGQVNNCQDERVSLFAKGFPEGQNCEIYLSASIIFLNALFLLF